MALPGPRTKTSRRAGVPAGGGHPGAEAAAERIEGAPPAGRGPELPSQLAVRSTHVDVEQALRRRDGAGLATDAAADGGPARLPLPGRPEAVPELVVGAGAGHVDLASASAVARGRSGCEGAVR